MRVNVFIVSAVLAAAAAVSSCGTGRNAAPAGSGKNLIIYYDPSAGSGELLGAAKKYGSRVIYEYKNFNAIAVTVPGGKSVGEAENFYRKVKGVLSVTKDRKLQLD